MSLSGFIFPRPSIERLRSTYSGIMNEYYVYLLRCKDGTIYVGVTNDYQKRFHEHQIGLHSDSYTYSRRPVKLLHVATFNDVHEAIAWEKHVKRWSNSKKLALARYDENALHILAKKRFPLRSQRRSAGIRWRRLQSTRASLRRLLRNRLLGVTNTNS